MQTNAQGASIGTTLLSTAGTAVGSYFGGPIGGAIGGMLGGLLGSALFRNRKPIIPDLNLMNSSYGNPIPIIYGSVRMAGTVIWMSTLDAQSHSAKGGGGGKGIAGPQVTSLWQSVMVAFCEGEAALTKLYLDGRLFIDKRTAPTASSCSGKIRSRSGNTPGLKISCRTSATRSGPTRISRAVGRCARPCATCATWSSTGWTWRTTATASRRSPRMDPRSGLHHDVQAAHALARRRFDQCQRLEHQPEQRYRRRLDPGHLLPSCRPTGRCALSTSAPVRASWRRRPPISGASHS